MSDELGTQLGEVEQNGTLSFGKDGKISDFSPANLEELIAFFYLPAQRSK